jgi:hypothetical protein
VLGMDSWDDLMRKKAAALLQSGQGCGAIWLGSSKTLARVLLGGAAAMDHSGSRVARSSMRASEGKSRPDGARGADRVIARTQTGSSLADRQVMRCAGASQCWMCAVLRGVLRCL